MPRLAEAARRSRLARVFGIAVAVLVAFPFASHFNALPALAECEPNREDDHSSSAFHTAYHVGWTKALGANPVPGVKSDIEVMNVYVDTGGSAHFGTSWVMLTTRSLPYSVWAQIGWEEHRDNHYHTFTQHTISDGVVDTNFYPPEPVGTTPKYQVSMVDATTMLYNFFVNGTSVGLGFANFAPTEGQIFAETNSWATQMPGEATANEHFNNGKILLKGAWYDFDGTPFASDPSQFSFDLVSPDHLDVWEANC